LPGQPPDLNHFAFGGLAPASLAFGFSGDLIGKRFVLQQAPPCLEKNLRRFAPVCFALQGFLEPFLAGGFRFGLAGGQDGAAKLRLI